MTPYPTPTFDVANGFTHPSKQQKNSIHLAAMAQNGKPQMINENAPRSFLVISTNWVAAVFHPPSHQTKMKKKTNRPTFESHVLLFDFISIIFGRNALMLESNPSILIGYPALPDWTGIVN
ncbi:hypothetical protein OUZ56_028997 [Daphnia magna]|uniref:Uncharacterized protein n=2 Tax=Daphnia magna TaxID=35525 RepID=A0ABR0B5I5_9CRUS|nr:hypothetical protein OUZ56_028997 [Daphnia magna]